MQTLLLSPKHSWVLLAFIVATHLVACGVVRVCSLPLPVFLSLFVCCLYSLAASLQQHVFSSKRAKKIHWGRGQGWYWLDAKNTLTPAILLKSSYVTPYLSILNFKIGSRSRHLILFPDALASDEARRLRVLLLTSFNSLI